MNRKGHEHHLAAFGWNFKREHPFWLTQFYLICLIQSPRKIFLQMLQRFTISSGKSVLKWLYNGIGKLAFKTDLSKEQEWSDT